MCPILLDHYSSGDIIFSSFIAGGTRVVVLPDQIAKAINKADCFCIRLYGKPILNHYLAYFLSTRTAYYQFENLVHGATRPRINTTQLTRCAIPLPSIIEQKETGL
jgi:type I restriction enzyme S subunit